MNYNQKLHTMIDESNNEETVKQEMHNQVANSGKEFETIEDEFEYIENYAIEQANDSAD